jgi:CheY-specific phosphatase CheX
LTPASPKSDTETSWAPACAARQFEALRVMVTDASVDMFTSCGFAVRVIDLNAPISPRKHDLAGFIGFAGALRGSLMISGPARVFHNTHPAALTATELSKTDLFDWTGEIANQLLGRIKRRFCERGRDFEASTPTAIEGRELVRRFPGRTGVLDLTLTVGGDIVSICFEVMAPADGQLFPEPAEPIEVSNEGELLLF